MRYFLCTRAASLLALAVVSGCSGGDLSDPNGAGAAETDVGSVNQAVDVEKWFTAAPPFSLSSVKIARNPTLSPYEWDDGGNPAGSSGKVCTGSARAFEFHAPCDTSYQLPFNPLAFPPARYKNQDIAAIAIAQNTSHVYTWYKNGLVSEGTSQVLAYYSQPHTVTGASYSFATLIDADVSPNGQVYYYWRPNPVDQPNRIVASVGTSVNAGGVGSEVITSQSSTVHLIGISFMASPNRVEAWYDNGRVVESPTSYDISF